MDVSEYRRKGITPEWCLTNNCCCTHVQSIQIMCCKIHLDNLINVEVVRNKLSETDPQTNCLQCLQNILPKFPYLYISLDTLTLPNNQYKLLVQAIHESNSS